MGTVRATVATRHAHEETGGRRRWFRLIVHDTVDELRDAAHRYRPFHGREWWENCAACHHPAPVRVRYGDDGEPIEIDTGFGGVIRFARDRLSTEVVAHECTHAALTAYRMNVTTFVHLGNGCGQREEQLAYIVGDLVAGVTNALHDLRVWG